VGPKIYIVYSEPTTLDLVRKHTKESTVDGSHERTLTHRVFVLALIILSGRQVFSFCFLSQMNRTPEIQVVISFFEILASCGEKFRVRRYHNAVQPARKKEPECETNVSCEKGLKDPEPVRFKYVSESAEGKSNPSARKGQRPSASRVVHDVFCGSENPREHGEHPTVHRHA